MPEGEDEREVLGGGEAVDADPQEEQKGDEEPAVKMIDTSGNGKVEDAQQ